MRKLKGSYDLPCPLFGIRWLGLTVFQAYSFVHYKGRSGDAKFTKWVGFCLHVAILAWILAVALSQFGFCRKRWTDRASFGMEAFFDLSYTALPGISGIYTIKGTYRLRKFLHGISIVATFFQLGYTNVDAPSVMNRTVVGI